MKTIFVFALLTELAFFAAGMEMGFPMQDPVAAHVNVSTTHPEDICVDKSGIIPCPPAPTKIQRLHRYANPMQDPAPTAVTAGQIHDTGAEVKLKPEVQVELLSAQKEMYQTMLRMKNLEQQYQELQRAFNTKQAEFNAKLFSALDRSGLDKKKFNVNPETLAVTAIPETKPAKEKKEK